MEVDVGRMYVSLVSHEDLRMDETANLEPLFGLILVDIMGE